MNECDQQGNGATGPGMRAEMGQIQRAEMTGASGSLTSAASAGRAAWTQIGDFGSSGAGSGFAPMAGGAPTNWSPAESLPTDPEPA